MTCYSKFQFFLQRILFYARVTFLIKLQTQLGFTCSKSTIQTLENDVKYVQSQQYKHQNDVIDHSVILSV